jgi:hypothetical protein
MSLFARVDVLDAIARQAGQDDGCEKALSETAFICTQHLLETTGSLVEALLEMGAHGERIFVQGKCYSTCPDVLDRLSRVVAYAHGGTVPEAPGGYPLAQLADIDRLGHAAASAKAVRTARRVVILDDGGRAIDRAKRALDTHGVRRVVGIEQTTFGVGRFGTTPPLVILVARSAAKILLEPPMIVDAVLAKTPVPLDGKRLRCGVVGLGNIGTALARRLAVRHEVAVHDVDPPPALPAKGLHWSETLADLIERSVVVFGCTGHDIFRSGLSALGRAYGTKIFVSCSSGDQEFQTLIRHIADTSKIQVNPLATLAHVFSNRETPSGRNLDVFFPHGSLEIIVACGGFPVNFDGSAESVPSRDIQLTRGLLLGAILQAILCYTAPKPTGTVTRMLDPDIQRFVVARWRKSRPLSPGEADRFPDLDRFDDEAWVRERSRGKHFSCPAVQRLFRGDRHVGP